MSKILPKGDNHQRRFIGCEVTSDMYDRFSATARATNRSRSGLIRHLLENADLILSTGDNHLKEGRAQ